MVVKVVVATLVVLVLIAVALVIYFKVFNGKVVTVQSTHPQVEMSSPMDSDSRGLVPVSSLSNHTTADLPAITPADQPAIVEFPLDTRSTDPVATFQLPQPSSHLDGFDAPLIRHDGVTKNGSSNRTQQASKKPLNKSSDSFISYWTPDERDAPQTLGDMLALDYAFSRRNIELEASEQPCN